MLKTVGIYLIRHGKTPGNEEKRYIGRTQESLSIKGREELLKWKDGRLPKAELLFSSPMLRCTETCACLYPGMQIREIPDFREIDFGSFEGKNYQELSGDPAYQAWIDSGGTMPFPQGEGRDAFIQRSLVGFSQLLEEIRGMHGEIKTVTAVVHGGTIMAILSKVCGGDYYDYQIPNGEGYCLQLELTEDDLRVLSLERI